MRSLLLYGITRSDELDALPTLAGVGDAKVSPLAAGPLAALISEPPPGQPDVNALERFHEVVSLVHQHRTIIPARYGNRIGGRDHLRRELDKHQAEHLERLRVLDGCVELGLRFLLPASSPARGPGAPQESPGRAYLEALWARVSMDSQTRQALEQEAARYLEACAGLYREHALDPAPREVGEGTRTASLCLLAPRMELPKLRRQVEACREGGSLELLVSGPWPPYSFAAAPKSMEPAP